MVWWKSERSWQTLAKARIRHRTGDFSLTLRYENDYGIDEELRQRIEGAGLDIGGRFHPQLNTVWTLAAEFPVGAGAERSTSNGGGNAQEEPQLSEPDDEEDAEQQETSAS